MQEPKRYVVRKTDLDTGIVVHETYYESKRRHREAAQGPAVVRRDGKTGHVVYEEYDRHGKMHRLDGPAVILYDRKTGRVSYEEYRQEGEIHREGDGPAIVETNPNTGLPVKECYYSDGELNRANGPARLLYDRNGNLDHVSYWQYGQRHRDPKEGPAEIDWEGPSRTVARQTYWVNGMRVGEPVRRAVARPGKLPTSTLE